MFTGDPLADTVVSKNILKLNSIKYENMVHTLKMRHQDSKNNKDSVTQELCEQILTELERVPEWVDWNKIERARQVFKDNLVLICSGLSVALVESYSFPIDAQVLFISGGLTGSRKQSVRRLMETGFWIFTVMKEGLKVGSKGHSSIVNVRLMHALARRLCLHSPEWKGEATQKSIDPEETKNNEGLILRFMRMKKGCNGTNSSFPNDQFSSEDRNTLNPELYKNSIEEEGLQETSKKTEGEVPINQANMLATLFLFCHVCLEVAQIRGAKLSEDDKDCYWHLWRYIGHLLGVSEHILPNTYRQGLLARYSFSTHAHAHSAYKHMF